MSATMPTFLKELFKEVLNPQELKMEKENPDKFTRHRLNLIEGNIIDTIKDLKEYKNYYVSDNCRLEKPVLVA